MKWRRTTFSRPSGGVEIAPDDWELARPGVSYARIYLVKGGPQSGRWAWFVHVWPDGREGSGGTGFADDGRGAREACETRLPEEARARIIRPAPERK